jgi:hypothetical protein
LEAVVIVCGKEGVLVNRQRGVVTAFGFVGSWNGSWNGRLERFRIRESDEKHIRVGQNRLHYKVEKIRTKLTKLAKRRPRWTKRNKKDARRKGKSREKLKEILQASTKILHLKSSVEGNALASSS